MARAFIAIGSNIDPEKNVRDAIRCLGRRTRLIAISMVYRTDALGRPEQPHYYNCVVEINTGISPTEVKQALLHGIEQKLGRERTEDKYAPRTIDLDLIVYDDLVMETENLRLPDPQILERPFLAIPLLELAPGLELAAFNLHIGEIAARLPQDGMKPLKDYTRLLREDAAC